MVPFTLTFPIKDIAEKLKSIFVPGYGEKERHFSRANEGIRNELDEPLHDFSFGYVAFPDVWGYTPAKGFRQPPSRGKSSLGNQIQREANNFFSKVICDFECEIESRVSDVEGGAGIKSVTDLINDVVLPLTQRERPTTLLIGGKIGCGKSTMIAAMMHAIWCRSDGGAPYTNIPIHLDLRELLSGLIDAELQNQSANHHIYVDKIEEVICKKIQF